MDFTEFVKHSKLSKKELSVWEKWYVSHYGKSKCNYLKFDETDLNFYRLFKEWNRLKGNNDNYFFKIISNIKAVLNYFNSIDSDKYKPHKHIIHPDFQALSLSPSHDILSESEIELIYNYSGKPYLENVRDLAIIQYHTCTRWSELKREIENLSKGNQSIYQRIIDGREVLLWDIKVEKTEKYKEFDKTIPVHKKVLEIINGESKPRSISIQKFNEYIKELLNELNIDKTKSITSHTWRRSFITNMVNKGFSQNEIMQYSGHKDERSFRLYCQRENLKIMVFNSIPTE
jgi:site-specific recombinase XerD